MIKLSGINHTMTQKSFNYTFFKASPYGPILKYINKKRLERCGKMSSFDWSIRTILVCALLQTVISKYIESRDLCNWVLMSWNLSICSSFLGVKRNMCFNLIDYTLKRVNQPALGSLEPLSIDYERNLERRKSPKNIRLPNSHLQ